MGPPVSAMTVVRPEKLEVEGLVKTFPGTRRRPAVTALDGIDLTVRAGELPGFRS